MLDLLYSIKPMKHRILLLTLAIIAPYISDIKSEVILKSSHQISIDSSLDSIWNPKVAHLMEKFQMPMQELVRRDIGFCKVRMEAKAPESLLSNLLADQLFEAAKSFSKIGIDAAVINISGIRSSLALGAVTVGDIYRVMPFENELVIVYLSGKYFEQLIQHIAKVGGEGISNFRFEIKNGIAVNIKIEGEALEPNRLYKVATIDYLANGNGGMSVFKNAEKCLNTHVKVRDAYIHQFEIVKSHGGLIESKLDGRIQVVKK
jgi:2',3'-cyclic-nucleotide 2'-phosphodiesterase (5'-nucleotidase family)